MSKKNLALARKAIAAHDAMSPDEIKNLTFEQIQAFNSARDLIASEASKQASQPAKPAKPAKPSSSKASSEALKVLAMPSISLPVLSYDKMLAMFEAKKAPKKIAIFIPAESMQEFKKIVPSFPIASDNIYFLHLAYNDPFTSSTVFSYQFDNSEQFFDIPSCRLCPSIKHKSCFCHSFPFVYIK